MLEAQGSVLTNKYAEAYPGKRYYNGCEQVDIVEQLAIARACKLFNCNYAAECAAQFRLASEPGRCSWPYCSQATQFWGCRLTAVT